MGSARGAYWRHKTGHRAVPLASKKGQTLGYQVREGALKKGGCISKKKGRGEMGISHQYFFDEMV